MDKKDELFKIFYQDEAKKWYFCYYKEMAHRNDSLKRKSLIKKVKYFLVTKERNNMTIN